MILELRQPLPLNTPKGKAWAHLVIDYGTEHHLLWVCFLAANGECWTFRNPEVRLEPNQTMNGVTHEETDRPSLAQRAGRD